MKTTLYGPDGVESSEASRETFWLVSPAGRVLVEYDRDPRPTDEAFRRRLGELESLLGDLFRCEHGRKSGDECALCVGPSKGGPLQGEVIGYSLDGRSIRLPEGPCWDHTNPAEWPREERR